MHSLLSSESYRRSRPPHRRLVPCVRIDNYFFRDVARMQPLILMETTAYTLKGCRGADCIRLFRPRNQRGIPPSGGASEKEPYRN